MSGTVSGITFTANGDDLDIAIYRGKSLHFEVVWGGATPIDVSGYSACLQARNHSGRLLMELSTANGRVANGGSNGKFTFNASPEVTRAVNAAGTYEVELTTSTGAVHRMMSGKISFVEEVAL